MGCHWAFPINFHLMLRHFRFYIVILPDRRYPWSRSLFRLMSENVFIYIYGWRGFPPAWDWPSHAQIVSTRQPCPWSLQINSRLMLKIFICTPRGPLPCPNFPDTVNPDPFPSHAQIFWTPGKRSLGPPDQLPSHAPRYFICTPGGGGEAIPCPSFFGSLEKGPWALQCSGAQLEAMWARCTTGSRGFPPEWDGPSHA